MKYGLTAIQRRGLDFIGLSLKTGVAPSYEEIRIHLGFKSKSSVDRVVHALIAKGWLVKLSGRARSLALVESAPAGLTLLLPLELDVLVQGFARIAGVSAADVVIEAVRDRAAFLRSHTRETAGRAA